MHKLGKYYYYHYYYYYYYFEYHMVLKLSAIGLLQLAITWYKIRHAGGQVQYYSRTGTLKQRDPNQ